MTKPGYRMTEIGEIPEEWGTSELRKMFKIITGTTPSTKIKKYWTGGTIEWLTPKDLSQMNDNNIISPSERKVTTDALNESNLNLLPEGSILISTRAPVGYVGINRAQITFNQGCKGLVPLVSEGYSSSFYAYYLKYKREFLNSVSSGSTFKELSKERLERLVVPIPPWLEQQKIAQILSTADETIQKANEEITLTEKLKKGLMQTLLTKGIGHTKFKMTEIGEIPEEWKVMNISDVTIEHKQGLYTNESYTDNGIKLVRITDLLNPNISYETMPFLNVNQKTYEQFKIEKGDFLIARSGAIGRYGIVNDVIHSVFGSYIIRYKFDSSRIDVKFFGYVYSSKHVLGALLKLKHGATNININADNIDGIKIPLPPLSEQQKIAEILSTVDQKLELLRNKKTHLGELKKGMMEDLLTGRVRVKIATSKGEN